MGEICDKCTKYKEQKEYLRNLILDIQTKNGLSYAQIYNILEEIQLELFASFIQQYVIPLSNEFKSNLKDIIETLKGNISNTLNTKKSPPNTEKIKDDCYS